MTTQTEALKLARTALGVQLDALLGKAGHLHNDDRRRYAENGIKAIDEALAQPEQNLNCKSTQARLATAWGYVKAEQEPVAWKDLTNAEMMALCRDIESRKHSAYDILWEASTRLKARNTTPPQRKPLTDEPTKEMIDAAERIDWSDSDVRGNIVNMWQAMCAAAHGIKE